MHDITNGMRGLCIMCSVIVMNWGSMHIVILNRFSPGQCVPFEYFCDGIPHCDDKSDDISGQSVNTSLMSQDTVICQNLRNGKNITCLLPTKYACYLSSNLEMIIQTVQAVYEGW